MSAVEKFKHDLHEFERSKTNKNVYRCIHPDCSYYWTREHLQGKRAICHKCKNPFILTWTQLRNKWPVCEFCTKSPRTIELQVARDMALRGLNDMPSELQFDNLNELLGDTLDKEKPDDNRRT